MFLHVSIGRTTPVSFSIFNLPTCLFVVAFGLLISLTVSSSVSAQAISFLEVAGSPDGEFGWDVFSNPYAGPHAPDLFSTGTGTANLTVSPDGGIVTTTGNLYSLMTTPTWGFNGTDLKSDLAFTSIAIQLVSAGAYNPADVLINGISPDEFTIVGNVSIGGFDTPIYWAEWIGLNSASSYNATFAAPAGAQHVSLAGAKFSYFNTATPYNIQAIPEPTSFVALMLMGAGFVLRRRKV